MSDKDLEVRFGADIANLLTGLRDAEEGTRTAAEGMKGDLGSMVQALGAMGPAALAAGAAMLALEGVKDLVHDFFETAEETNHLTEQFKMLSITAGMSQEDFNKYNAAVTLAGGSSQDLETITRGMQRGIKANAEVLIENGIAANKAALAHMTMGEYLSKVMEKMEQYGDATDRDQLLMAAFGRGGMQFAEVLEEMNKKLKEGKDLGGGAINAEALKLLEAHRAAAGRLKLAQEELNAVMATSAGGIQNFAENLKAAALEEAILNHQVQLAIDNRQILRQVTAGGLEDIQAEIAAYKQLMGVINEASGAMDAGARNRPEGGGHFKAKDTGGATGGATGAAASPGMDPSQKAAAEEYEKNWKKVHEVTQEETGRLLNKQAADAKNTLAEQAAYEDNVHNQGEKIQEQISKQKIKLAQDEVKRLKQLEEEKKANAHATYQAMTAGFASSIQAGIMGQEKWGQVTKQVLAQALQNQVSYFMNLAEQKAENAVVGLVLSKMASLAEIQNAAALAAANAFASEAAIPMIGPAAAPGAAAAAYSQAMSLGGFLAGAEGGWDRVPATQLALLHTQEMVLPAHIAEPVRQMAEGGGGGVQVHIHAADSKSVVQMIARNTGGIGRQIQQSLKRGRF